MIKILSLFTAVCASLLLMTGCGGNGSDKLSDNALPSGVTLSIVTGKADTMNPPSGNDTEHLLNTAAHSVIISATEGMAATISVDGETKQGAIYMINGSIEKGIFDLVCRWYTDTGYPMELQMYGIHLKRGELNGTFEYWISNDVNRQFRGTAGTINYVN